MAVTINASTSSGVITTADNSGALQLQTNSGQTAMTIDTSQKVLVNTTTARANFQNSPTSPQLQLEGTDAATSIISSTRNSADTGGPRLMFGKSRGATIGSNTIVQNGDNVGQIAFEGNDGAEFVDAASISAIIDGTPGANDMPGALLFNTTADGASSPTERMRIDSNGRIQINDTTPVSGFTAKLTITSPTASESNITLKDSGTTYATGTQYISFVNSSNAGSGSIQHTAVTTVAYATTSDSRLKENIVNAPNSLDTINGIKIRSFDWKEDKHHTDYGLIAQELYQVFPEAVLKGDDGEEITNPKETWQVEYGRLTPLLVKAIQEQQTIITELKSRIEALEGAK